VAKANQWTPIGPWEGEVNKGLSELTISVITMDPIKSTTLYVGVEGTGAGDYDYLFRTTDGGRSWHELQNPLQSPFAGTGTITSIIVDPHNSKILYISDDEKISKSTDAGTTWTGITPHFVLNPPDEGWTPVNIASLAMALNAPEILYALPRYYGGVYKSTDGGSHWIAINTELQVDSGDEIFVDPTTSTTVYVTASSNLLKSTDGGQTWQKRSTGLPKDTSDSLFASFAIRALAIEPQNSDILYLGTDDGWGNDGNVFKSTNGGETWVESNTGLENVGGIMTLLIDPSNPSTIYAASSRTAVFKSTDSAKNWKMLDPDNSVSAYFSYKGNNLVIEPNHPTRLYAGTGNGVFIYGELPDSFGTTAQCATFNGAVTPQLEIPCLQADSQLYKAGLNLLDPVIFKFELEPLSLAQIDVLPSEECSTFAGLENKLHLPCVKVGEDILWVDLLLINSAPFQFKLEKFGIIE
ncbi:MAG: hypothetical protein VSS75_009740, partial [Candidatus Parabeggiatoa sp.]|nr:hypothetical protein [Candidatus Parabeggiatoa sp.]